MTGQPDFACLSISYTPNKKCVELKSLKLYLNSFRNTGAYHEAVTNELADTLEKIVQPKKMKIVANFNVRGGLQTSIIIER